MNRFYVDGIEIEINDPLFYMTKSKIEEYLEALTELRGDYVADTMAQG